MSGRLVEDPLLEAHSESRDEATLAHLVARAADEAAGRPMLPSEASHAGSRGWLRVSPFGIVCPRAPRGWPRSAGIFDALDVFTGHPLPRTYDTPASVRRIRTRMRGLLPTAVIVRVLDRNVAALEQCTRLAGRLPGGEGDVVVRFEIGRDGDVFRSRVARSSIPQPITAACLESVVRRLEFSPPPSQSMVTAWSSFEVRSRTRGRPGRGPE